MLTDEDRARGRATRRRNAKLRQELARKEKEAKEARIKYALDKMRLPELLTTTQAGELLGVTGKTVREWIKQGKLTGYRWKWRHSKIKVSTQEVQELQRRLSSDADDCVKKIKNK